MRKNTITFEQFNALVMAVADCLSNDHGMVEKEAVFASAEITAAILDILGFLPDEHDRI